MRAGDLRKYKMNDDEKAIAKEVQIKLIEIWNRGLGFNSDDASRVCGQYEGDHKMKIKFQILSLGGANGIHVIAKIL